MPSYDSINRAYTKDDLQMMQQAQVFHDLFVVDQLAFSTAFPKFLTPYETNFQTAIDDADAIPLDTTIAGEIVVKSAEIEAQMELVRPALHFVQNDLFTF